MRRASALVLVRLARNARRRQLRLDENAPAIGSLGRKRRTSSSLSGPEPRASCSAGSARSSARLFCPHPGATRGDRIADEGWPARTSAMPTEEVFGSDAARLSLWAVPRACSRTRLIGWAERSGFGFQGRQDRRKDLWALRVMAGRGGSRGWRLGRSANPSGLVVWWAAA
jgi:hypothetical protein